MLTKSKIVLSLALVLGTASVAVAAPTHHTGGLVPAAAYSSFASAPRTSRVPVATYMHIQTQDNNESVGCPC